MTTRLEDAPLVTTLEQIDTSDLDSLDDDKRHARCTYCQPHRDLFEPFVALCGVTAVHRDIPVTDAPPVNSCEECRVLWYAPCARCGE